jgi:hypothetical protein
MFCDSVSVNVSSLRAGFYAPCSSNREGLGFEAGSLAGSSSNWLMVERFEANQ